MQTVSSSQKRPGAHTALAALAAAFIATAAMADTSKPPLFKIVTVKDEVIVAVPQGEPAAPSAEVGAIGQALVDKGAVTLWQYAVRKAPDGALEMAPRGKISVLRHDSLRVEPYTAAVRVVPLP